MSENDAIILNTIIAVAVSAIGSLISYFLSVKKGEKDARRDYEYDARKQLYENYEPYMFQFHQLCEEAYQRIADLAKNLREERRGLLQDNSVYIINTVYRILTPLAMFRVMEQRLTKYDLELDKQIKNEYLFAKALYNILRNSKLIVSSNQENISDKKAVPKEKPSEAIHLAEIEKMTEALLQNKGGQSDKIRIISLAEFTDLNDKKPFYKICKLFVNFNPNTSLVFWTNLLSYAYICRAICTLPKNPRNKKLITLSKKKKPTTLDTFSVSTEEFFWHKVQMEKSNIENRNLTEQMSQIVDTSFRHAKKYLQLALAGPFDNC